MDKPKDVEWLGDSQEVIREFPEDVRADLGADLFRLQKGMEPNNWKPFPGLKKQAFELRAKDQNGIYRTIYVTFVKNKIYVLHCFQKKSPKTAKGDVEKANERLKSLISTTKRSKKDEK
ncbi:MAG: type II toxin-antitoxin system RelE/ParE family toxin [Oligoflexus sp.]